MTFAIVILNWNGRALLQQFLPSVVLFSPEYDIYVVDNASTDNSVGFLRENFPTVRIIENATNEGYAKGYNVGLKSVEADVYCLLNSDVRVGEGWLSPIKELFERQDVAIVQPKILDEKAPERFEYAGAAGGFIDKYGYPYCRGRVFDVVEEDNGQYDSDIPIFWASGACFFIRSGVFWQLAGFDEDFFAHQEEIDLCWRAHHLGKKVLCCGESSVWHVGGATLSSQSTTKTFLNFRNSLFMLLKNLPSRGLYTTLLLRMLLDGVAGVRFLFQGKPSFMWAIVRAHWAFYGRFFHFKRKRPKELLQQYYALKSVVWAYFIKGKKRYTQLE